MKLLPSAEHASRRLIAVRALLRHWEQTWARRGAPSAQVTQVVGASNLPADIRSLSSLTKIDYADHLSYPTSINATAERWARTMFGNIPDFAERLIWKGCLRLRLSPTPSPDTAGGWRIAAREPDWIRLEAASWFLTGNLVVTASHGQASLTTCIRFEHPFGRVVWGALGPLHRLISPGFLPDAAAKIQKVEVATANGSATRR
ncbi:hypothetical protein [Actinopolymorpha alba]|uniref:hypothetical protein n=1 Tax=Actinopolymorpha alba TaxID=533267 RepID=UPI0003A4AE6A|nr:hypothetical protein [Actinopolymorpha alba]